MLDKDVDTVKARRETAADDEGKWKPLLADEFTKARGPSPPLLPLVRVPPCCRCARDSAVRLPPPQTRAAS